MRALLASLASLAAQALLTSRASLAAFCVVCVCVCVYVCLCVAVCVHCQYVRSHEKTGAHMKIKKKKLPREVPPHSLVQPIPHTNTLKIHIFLNFHQLKK